MRNRKGILPGLCKYKNNSPMKSLGKKITRALGGGKKIAGCKYNPGG